MTRGEAASKRHGYAVSRADRILVIAKMKLGGTWERGATKVLAAEWGVPLHLAEQSAGDADVLLSLVRALNFDAIADAKADVLARVRAALV